MHVVDVGQDNSAAESEMIIRYLEHIGTQAEWILVELERLAAQLHHVALDHATVARVKVRVAFGQAFLEHVRPFRFEVDRVEYY